MGQLSNDIENDDLNGEESDNLGKGGHILKAKVKLMDILNTKMSEYLLVSDSKAAQGIVSGICE